MVESHSICQGNISQWVCTFSHHELQQRIKLCSCHITLDMLLCSSGIFRKYESFLCQYFLLRAVGIFGDFSSMYPLPASTHIAEGSGHMLHEIFIFQASSAAGSENLQKTICKALPEGRLGNTVEISFCPHHFPFRHDQKVLLPLIHHAFDDLGVFLIQFAVFRNGSKIECFAASERISKSERIQKLAVRLVVLTIVATTKNHLFRFASDAGKLLVGKAVEVFAVDIYQIFIQTAFNRFLSSAAFVLMLTDEILHRQGSRFIWFIEIRFWHICILSCCSIRS